MRLLISPNPDGHLQVTDADTGNSLPWVQAFQSDLDASGRPWLWLGTTAFSSLLQFSAVPPTVAPPAPAAK